MMRSVLAAIYIPSAKFLIAPLCLLVSACTPAPPETVVSDFWAAALIGDKQSIEALVLPESFDQADFDSAKYHRLFTQASIGDIELGSRQAHVQTYLHGHFQDIDFNTVLVLHQRSWRVDYAATTGEMIAVLLNAAVATTDKEIQQNISTLSGSVTDAIRDDWRDFDRLLNEN